MIRFSPERGEAEGAWSLGHCEAAVEPAGPLPLVAGKAACLASLSLLPSLLSSFSFSMEEEK